jgi:NitT/TauT family transport system permease protein
VSRVRSAARELGPPLAGVAALIAVWAVLAAATTSRGLPSPLDVWNALRHGIADGTIPQAAWRTLLRLAFSFAISIAVGTALGAALSLNEFVRRSVRPLVVAMQIAPPVAVLPLAIVWFGFTERAVVFVAIVGAFPSVTIATIASVRQVPPLLVRAGKTLGARGWELYRSVVFPAALPGYMGGVQQAWGFAWKSLLAGEIIVGASRATGLGQILARSQTNVPALLAALAVVVVIGVAVEYLVFGQIDRRIRGRRGLLLDA